ncbi:Protein of unknown function (DUF1566), partial [Methanophagales archaeon]
MSQKQKLGIAAGAICLLLCTFGAFACAEPQLSLANSTTKLNEQPTNHNPAYSGQVVEEPPITVDLEHNFEEEQEEWIENILTVTNPRDVAVTTKIALNYIPFIWSNGTWTPGEARTAITIDDVVVAPHAAVPFTVSVKAERTTEKGIYRASPRLISVDNWNESVPAYKSVIVVNSEKIWDKESDAPGGCTDRRDNDGDGWVDVNDTDCPLSCNCDNADNYSKVKFKFKFKAYNREGDRILVDCETEKYWTVKAFFTYSWGPPWVKVTHSCIQKGSDFPASDYCDELEYGGYSDWILPDKDTLLDLAKSGFVSDRDRYWSSTPVNETLAHCVCFDTKQQIAERR